VQPRAVVSSARCPAAVTPVFQLANSFTCWKTYSAKLGMSSYRAAERDRRTSTFAGSDGADWAKPGFPAVHAGCRPCPRGVSGARKHSVD
jgi:hypothetical protein